MHYTASNQTYIIIAKLAISSSSHETIDHAVRFFHALINGEVEGVLDHILFARSLVDLVRRTTAPATKVIDEKEETALVELLFEICTKIRLDPDILPAWFYPERVPGKSLSSLEARRAQFPLFYILVDYVHYDGPIGDFARTALLYLTETSSRSRPLETWMMESDLAHQMASGLSALYGRLSRHAPGISKKALPILSFSDTDEAKDDQDEFYDDTGMDMRAFLSYLAFWQDTLSHCKSIEVRDTLLDSFQVLFVEQLLYPSLLESSDVEGGSTAAVILHLCRLLGAIDHQRLINRMLSYLFATKSQPVVSKNQRARNRLSMSRRRSMEQLATLASRADRPSPELFDLLDLIVFSMRSSSPQTVTSALKLITVLLRRHHPHVRHRLFTLEALMPVGRQNLNGLNDTMMTLFDQAGAISAIHTIDSSYQAALRDAQTTMEHHSCLFDDDTMRQAERNQMTVSSHCKVVEQMASLLESWFANDTLVNLELTGAFGALASCEYVLMRSWLAPEQPDQVSVVLILEQLIQQVKQWRARFVEWDAFYSIQRVDLMSEDELSSLDHSGMSVINERISSVATARQGSPSLSPQTVANRVAAMRADSIDGRIANDGNTAVEHGSARQVSDGQLASDGSTRSVSSGNLSATLLETRIPIGTQSHRNADRTDNGQDKSEQQRVHGAAEGVTAATDDSGMEHEREDRSTNGQPTASLRHVLTQAIILQEFILELGAALQIRATLFDEVDLS